MKENRRMKRSLSLLLAVLLLVSAGCAPQSPDDTTTTTTVAGTADGSSTVTTTTSASGSPSSSGNLTTTTTTVSGTTVTEFSLQAGEYTLCVSRKDSNWQLVLTDQNSTILYRNDTPAEIRTVEDPSDVCAVAQAAYQTARLQDGMLICTATVVSHRGARFAVRDVYSVNNDGFLMDRTVTVTDTSGGERGFASVYSLYDVNGGTQSDYEYFIPSVLYKDSAALGTDSIMQTFVTRNYVKETRCGTPLAMLRDTDDGYSVGLVHVSPHIYALENQFRVESAIDNTQQYGSLGYTLRSGQVSVDYVYPSTETPRSYEAGGTVSRYHEIRETTVQNYVIGILPAKTAQYNDAMVDTYLAALALETPTVAEVDLDQVYAANMELYNELYLYYENTTTGRHSAGLPFAVNVKNLDDFYAVSFQMGFIGCQTAIAAEMLREGYLNSNAGIVQKGTEILDFWTADYVYTDVLPPSWWRPSENSNAGKSAGYPSFLRCFVDGAEGMLNACLYAKEAGADYHDWEAAVLQMANFLVDHQNEDGSYYRAYNTDGTVCTSTESPNYQGTSKLNTPVAVRFLCRMYDYTGDRRYYTAAVNAAEYCYKELYLKLGKYVGGTPDNPNVPDKEAAIYALYAFSAVYDMTGEDRYYAALEHAAVNAMSWVYTYDFTVPYALTEAFDGFNIFKQGNTAGWSIIATGHSSIDVFGSAAYYELFKQYLRSGDDGYLKVAGLLQNNTKTAMDLEGRWGYLYSGMCLEACNVADQVFYTAANGVWLPWISAVFMEPMIQMKETFGEYDMYVLLKAYSREELLQMANS